MPRGLRISASQAATLQLDLSGGRGAAQQRPSRLRLTQPEAPESAVLAAVLGALALHPAVAWVHRLNTGAHVAGEGSARRFVRYGFPGCPDVVAGLRDGRTAWIEVKRRSGVLSAEQLAFGVSCQAAGIPWGVARSVDDAVAIVTTPRPDPGVVQGKIEPFETAGGQQA